MVLSVNSHTAMVSPAAPLLTALQKSGTAMAVAALPVATALVKHSRYYAFCFSLVGLQGFSIVASCCSLGYPVLPRLCKQSLSMMHTGCYRRPLLVEVKHDFNEANHSFDLLACISKP